MFTWENLHTAVRSPEVWRAKVPGGWFVWATNVNVETLNNWSNWQSRFPVPFSGLTFYPDPDHVWDGSTGS